MTKKYKNEKICREIYKNVKYVQYDIYYKYVFIRTFPNVLRMLFADAKDTVSVLLQKQMFRRQSVSISRHVVSGRHA